MPFRSEAQRRFLFAKHPEIASRWAHEYGTPRNLPMHVTKEPEGQRGSSPVHRNWVALEQWLGAGDGKEDARRLAASVAGGMRVGHVGAKGGFGS